MEKTRGETAKIAGVAKKMGGGDATKNIRVGGRKTKKIMGGYATETKKRGGGVGR